MSKWTDRGPAPVCSDGCPAKRGFGVHTAECPFTAWTEAGTANRQTVADLDPAQQSALRVTELESALIRATIDFITREHPEITRVERAQALSNMLSKEVAYLVEDERHP